MAIKNLIIDFSEYDLDHVVADIDEIRRYNPQRFEMEQLTAIVFDDVERGICVGYKDVTDHEFWARGHMPGMPLMPGVSCARRPRRCAAYFVAATQSDRRRNDRLRRHGRRPLPRHGRPRRSPGDHRAQGATASAQ